jgi:hypothetical protein
MAYRVSAVLVLLSFGGRLADGATAQQTVGPPAVDVVRAERQQITQTDEFVGRVQAVGRVTLVARVAAFLEKRFFVEGSDHHEARRIEPSMTVLQFCGMASHNQHSTTAACTLHFRNGSSASV